MGIGPDRSHIIVARTSPSSRASRRPQSNENGRMRLPAGHRPARTSIWPRYDRREPVKHIRTRTLLAAGAIAVGAAIPRGRHRHLRRRRDVPVSDLRQVGGRLQKGNRQRPELPVDRLRRRHQADHRQDRDLRRLRHAAEGRAAREGRPGPVPDRAGRRRAGHQRRRHQGRRHRSRRHRRSPTSSWARSRPGTTRRSEAQRLASSCRRSRSSSCTARTARAPRSCSPTICRR